ncbi:MAG: hypothetical protein Q4B84_03030 [Clostridia bacterium]|nr:hypothetical protein [Clostridia bacterium]
MEHDFLKKTGYEIARKGVLFFSGLCFGAALAHIKIDISMFYFCFFVGLVFMIFDINLKKESKIRKWNNKRFVCLTGFPIFFMLIAFVALGIYRGDRSLYITMSIFAFVELIATFINLRHLPNEVK